MVRLLNLDFVDACASMVCTFHWRDAINHIHTKFYYDNQSQGTIIGGPSFANNLWWWNVNFTSGVDGWAAETYLVSSTNALTPYP
jgi:hypothetical protein